MGLHTPPDNTSLTCHVSGQGTWLTYTRGALRTAQRQPPALVAVEDDLPVVGDLLDVGAVVVQAHVAHQQDLAVGEVAGEPAVGLPAGGRGPGPLAVHAGGGVVPGQREPVLCRV